VSAKGALHRREGVIMKNKLNPNLAWVFGVLAGLIGIGATFALMKAGAGKTVHYAVFGVIFLAAGFATTFLTSASIPISVLACGLVGGGIMAGFYYWALKSLFTAVGGVAAGLGGSAAGSAMGSLGSAVGIVAVLIVLVEALVASAAGSVAARKIAKATTAA
jgi:hypothetical protein